MHFTNLKFIKLRPFWLFASTICLFLNWIGQNSSLFALERISFLRSHYHCSDIIAVKLNFLVTLVHEDKDLLSLYTCNVWCLVREERSGSNLYFHKIQSRKRAIEIHLEKYQLRGVPQTCSIQFLIYLT